MSIKIDVEYCGSCGYFKQFEELVTYLKVHKPEINVDGHEGRRASFEVKVNGSLVHSKLSSLAYPDYEDLIKIAEEVSQGQEARNCKKQPITSCVMT